MRYLKTIGLLLLCISCGEQLMEPPSDLIPKEQMMDILYDIAIMDAIDNNYPKVLEQNGLDVMEFVFEKYGIDSLQFVQSDLYYAANPVEYQQIYDSLEARILRKKDSITEVIQGGNSPVEPEEEEE